MGCASSAPLMGEGGPLGEIKDAANNLVESGEHALHDMGEAAGKTINEAIDHVKDAASSAARGIQDAAGHIGGNVGKAANSVTDEVKKGADSMLNSAPQVNGNDPNAYKFIPLKSSMDEAEEMALAVDEIMNTPPHSPSSDIAVPPTEMFRPTPVPSFDKPPTPSATVISLPDLLDKPLEKIEETMNASIDELTDDLMKETENVMEEAKEVASEAVQAVTGNSETPTDLESDLPPTKWEALADAIVELPPRMSIDLGTGQLYVKVEEDSHSKSRSYAKPAVLKEVSGENITL